MHLSKIFFFGRMSRWICLMNWACERNDSQLTWEPDGWNRLRMQPGSIPFNLLDSWIPVWKAIKRNWNSKIVPTFLLEDLFLIEDNLIAVYSVQHFFVTPISTQSEYRTGWLQAPLNSSKCKQIIFITTAEPNGSLNFPFPLYLCVSAARDKATGESFLRSHLNKGLYALFFSFRVPPTGASLQLPLTPSGLVSGS